MVTLEQVLNFRMSNGKRLRDLSADDWRQWLKRIRAEYAMLVARNERDITDEEDRHLHAVADRLDDLITAMGIIGVLKSTARR
jgi:hypothetical protein